MTASVQLGAGPAISAIEMEVPDIGHLRVIHPLDVLDSRIQNLHVLPEKRTDAGIAQAMLAVDVARAFVTPESCSTRGLSNNLSPSQGAMAANPG